MSSEAFSEPELWRGETRNKFYRATPRIEPELPTGTAILRQDR